MVVYRVLTEDNENVSDYAFSTIENAKKAIREDLEDTITTSPFDRKDFEKEAEEHGMTLEAWLDEIANNRYEEYCYLIETLEVI